VFEWDFPQAAPPSDEIKNLLKSYFSDGEIEWTTAGFVCGYLVERLSEDYLADEWSDCAPWSRRPPVCRIVCYNGDDD